ncbi:carbon-nitrogen hydrolase family protein [Hyphobacterium sp.]|jgi:predicted amidohydrolase|uniref:carbon-nitrogen hydrolase family protein n=1 Tax=Hyphobacterium sp. TaxID=2004662 RepID=UPI003BA8BB19
MRAGLIQMRSGVSTEANLEAADTLIRKAVSDGAQFVATPETTHLVQKDADRLFETMRTPEDDPAIPFFASLARELGITLLIGSLALKVGDRRAVNRSHLFGSDGCIIATYDKIHMFDVGLGKGETYSESTNYRPGDEAVLADVPGARLGLTICYDVRFPYLYRRLAQVGAEIFTVPAAFTRPTGKAHWNTLLRARAIETGSYVLAPAQGGQHEDGRKTWGHSLIVGPWGEVVAGLDHDEPGCLIADVEIGKVASARKRIPSLEHDRRFTGPS